MKRVVERTPGSLLTFDVVEQTINTRDSMMLIDGGFTFEPHAEGTRVTLATRYRPHMAPRVVWRPAETLVVRTLHRHVIGGIRLEAQRKDALAVSARAP